jgi:hypothetical protein
MAHSYTPGLRVSKLTRVTKERRLPLRGEVLVKVGDIVKANKVVARTELPGNVHPVNCCGQLGILPADIESALCCKPGDPIKKDQIIAKATSFFGLFKSHANSPIDGTLESASPITGQVILREPPIPVEVTAYIDGTVINVFEGEGVEIECYGSFIQGIFGIGGERYGAIKMMVKAPDELLDVAGLKGDLKGYILVAGKRITMDAYKKATDLGAVAVVTGGFEHLDLKKILGYEQGVAITGHEDIPTSLVLTEGFGDIEMAHRTFDLLKANEGNGASISGATQIRAGVIRPEIIIPHPKGADEQETHGKGGGLEVGDTIRIIRDPYFGKIGEVTSLPPELQLLETGAKVRVLEAQVGNEKIILPRANIELIEE